MSTSNISQILTNIEENDYFKAYSSDIRIFPFSQDRATDPFARHLSETNIRSMMRYTTDYDSFFISSKDISNDAENDVHKEIEFFLGGHYINVVATLETDGSAVKADSSTNELWLGTYVYAKIIHQKSLISTTTYSQLMGSDRAIEPEQVTRFDGVKFFGVDETTANTLGVRGSYPSVLGMSPDTTDVIVTYMQLFTPVSGWDSMTRDNLLKLDFNTRADLRAFEKFNHNSYETLKWGEF